MVGDISKLMDETDANRPAAIAAIVRKWTAAGADPHTIRIRQTSDTSENPVFGASFAAGHTTFMIFSWFLSTGSLSNVEMVNYPVSGGGRFSVVWLTMRVRLCVVK